MQALHNPLTLVMVDIIPTGSTTQFPGPLVIGRTDIRNPPLFAPVQHGREGGGVPFSKRCR